MLRNLRGHEWITYCVVVAVLNAYTLTALASPGAIRPRGDLSVTGLVTLNGEDAISGTTVFSSSSLTTARDSAAVIKLIDLGHVTLLQNTAFSIEYSASRIAGSLDSGGAEFSALEGASVEVSAGGVRVTSDAGGAASFSVRRSGDVTTVAALRGTLMLEEGGRQLRVAAGEYFSTGMASPAAGGQQPPDDDDDTGRKAAFLLLGIGAVVAAIILVVTRSDNDDLSFGGDSGGGINPSPSR
jgi:ferric-dicitrate binding protein FerR (iron transport regulator)